MQFSVQLPVDRVNLGSTFTSAQGITSCASFVEAAGFNAAFVTDHPIPDSKWLAQGGHHSFDPFVALSCAACATNSLKLFTNIMVLPYRNPFLVAKSVSSLDTLSNGRMILGVGAGYLKGEFSALGVGLENRGALVEEALQAMKVVWRGDTTTFKGKKFEAVDNISLPTPVQQPHPPIWMGGNSNAAMRRAAQYCDGWLPFPVKAKLATHVRTKALVDLSDLKMAINELRQLEKQFDRTQPLDIAMVPFGLYAAQASQWDADAIVNQCRELEALGVTWVNITLPSDSMKVYQEAVTWFAEKVIHRLSL